MAKCPKCGNQIEKAYKTWTMKPYKKANIPPIKVSLYACPNCGNKFRKGESIKS